MHEEINKTAVIEKLNSELHSRVNELTQLYAISEGLNEFMDTPTMFERIARLARKVTRAQRVSVMVLDRSRRSLRIRAALGMSRDVMEASYMRIGEGIAGRVAESGRTIRVAEFIGEQEWTSGRQESREYETHSWMSLPLRIGREVFGVINVTSKIDGTPFTRQDEKIMLALAERAGSKLENQALYEGIYANLMDTLMTLVSTLEAKDPYTRRHSQRVTEFAMQLAEAMGLQKEAIEMINFAGMLHDIGKIGIADGILTKTGKLTDEEYAMIKEHPVIGERIVAPLGLLAEERAIIRNHHERWDGKGYPDGLVGEAIPSAARILAVADAFDAMTTTRSYREALDVETALQEMALCSGTQFDPRICGIWIAMVRQGDVKVGGHGEDGTTTEQAQTA
jgi:putative nucleotidyltransferase with HDIG domain